MCVFCCGGKCSGLKVDCGFVFELASWAFAGFELHVVAVETELIFVYFEGEYWVGLWNSCPQCVCVCVCVCERVSELAYVSEHVWSLFCAKNTTFAVSFWLRILYDLPSASGLEQLHSTVRDLHSNSPFADTSAFNRPQSAFHCPLSTLCLILFRNSCLQSSVICVWIHLSLIHPHSTVRNPRFTVHFRLLAQYFR